MPTDSYAQLLRRLGVPAIHIVVRRDRPPLNLDAPIYRYRVACDGSVSVIDEPVGARSCHGEDTPLIRRCAAPSPRAAGRRDAGRSVRGWRAAPGEGHTG
jgi:hypothetical protein